MIGTGYDPDCGNRSHFLSFLPPQLGLEYSSVAKEEARRWKEGGRVFRNTRSIQISFSSVFPMLSPPSTVSTESSQEPGYSLLGRRTKLSRVTKGKRINIYQVPAMHRYCSKFLCRLYLTYTCTHLADEKTEDLRGYATWDNKASRWWSQG